MPRLNLPEGGFAELTLILRKRPKPPEVGKPAPPFSVRTIEGNPLSLDDLRGKFVLLHFWSPTPVSNGLVDLSHLKAVADRFREDDRFLMVSLCMVDHPDGRRNDHQGQRPVAHTGQPAQLRRRADGG